VLSVLFFMYIVTKSLSETLFDAYDDSFYKYPEIDGCLYINITSIMKKWLMVDRKFVSIVIHN